MPWLTSSNLRRRRREPSVNTILEERDYWFDDLMRSLDPTEDGDTVVEESDEEYDELGLTVRGW